ncbi:MAG: hypothetical protein JNL22_14250 [Bacteroidales bacterium]|nr:hypothetical protein [Bacteroidales bacterium]
MKQILIVFLLSLTLNWISIAQSVSNLRFEQSGKMIEVFYDLAGKVDETFTVKLFCSQDGGKTWGTALKYVTGAVGENVAQGYGKKISWDVLKERDKLMGEINFKIEATSRSYCQRFIVTHNAGSVAPVTKTVTYAVVETDLSGAKKCWITQNLGADRQATSATDATEPSAGWYWQFNRKQGYKHDGTTRKPNTTWISTISENSDWLPANDPCTLLLGSGWRLPTGTEWDIAQATSGWTNYNETYTSVLKLHAGGRLYEEDGSLSNRGSFGFCWSSSEYNANGSRYLIFNVGSVDVNDYFSKAYGFSARCLRN